MRIDEIRLENFKKFKKFTLDLHPRFTLLVGENGAGKTSVLDALAASLGVWLATPPDTSLSSSKRNILRTEIRLDPDVEGDRVLFRERLPVVVWARGKIGDEENIVWERRLESADGRTTNAGVKKALEIIHDLFSQESGGKEILFPVVAYYGAGRGWLPSNSRKTNPSEKSKGPARRWSGFYDCFSERIRFADFREWFKREVLASGNRNGRMRPGFEVVRRAILSCVPDADGIWFDSDRDQIVLDVGGVVQPFDNLSAGQRMILALAADIAIRAVSQNASLLPPDVLDGDETTLPRLLRETPGVVLIDELDVHLHPRWQRRVAADLKRTFPGIQFVCTSHSPQIIGELPPDEIRVFDGEKFVKPERSFGIDSSRILEELMDVSSRNEGVEALLHDLFRDIDNERFNEARARLKDLQENLGPDDPEVTRAEALMNFLEEPLPE